MRDIGTQKTVAKAVDRAAEISLSEFCGVGGGSA